MMLYQLIPILMALVAGAVAGFAWRERKRQRESFLVLTNGKTVKVKRCIASAGVFKCANNEIYPDVDAMVTFLGRDTYYLLAVEPVALATHQQLELVRPSIVVGSLFKPGGGLIEILRTLSIAVMIAVSVMVASSFGDLRGSISAQTLEVKLMREQLSKPLVSVPVQVATPTPGATP